MSHWSGGGGQKTSRIRKNPTPKHAVRPRDAPYAQRRPSERFSHRLYGRNRLPGRLAATDPAPNGAGHAVKQFYTHSQFTRFTRSSRWEEAPTAPQ